MSDGLNLDPDAMRIGAQEDGVVELSRLVDKPGDKPTVQDAPPSAHSKTQASDSPPVQDAPHAVHPTASQPDKPPVQSAPPTRPVGGASLTPSKPVQKPVSGGQESVQDAPTDGDGGRVDQSPPTEVGHGDSSRPTLRPGQAHQSRPKTPDEIDILRLAVNSNARTLDQVAEDYGTTPRTINRWCKQFGIAREKQIRSSFHGKATRIADAAQSAAAAVIGAVRAEAPIGSPDNPEIPVLPENDSEVQDLLQEIEDEARNIHSVGELSRLQNKLMRLLTMAMARNPMRSWVALADASANLFRMILYARRVEADMPTKNDPAVLRQEAGRQMMDEVASVLDKDEQKALGILLQAAAERLAAKRGMPLITHAGDHRPPQEVESPTPEMKMANDPNTAGAPGTQTTVVTQTNNVPGAAENPW